MAQYTDQNPDNDLIHAYREGDKEALAFLIQRYLGSLYRFLYRMVQDSAVAEDLTQETFLKLWKHQARFDLSKTFKTWLFTIGKNVALDHLRKKQPLLFAHDEENNIEGIDLIPDREPLASELLERRETAQYLNEALTELSPETRSIVLMHESEDMTFQEIAEAVGKPMNTVKSRYRRALSTLRDLLTQRLLP